MVDSMMKYPIGSKVRLSCDYPDDEPHEVIGYKQIVGANYLIFKDGQTGLAERVEKIICPKCGRSFPRLLALSRVDNHTMICDNCGITEALDGVPDGILSPQERTRIAVMATGNKWAMENFNVTHN